MLGNVITAVIAGAGTLIFLEVAGVPYPVALGLLVAVLDLIPVIGSTVGGLLVTLIALSVSVAVAGAVFLRAVPARRGLSAHPVGRGAAQCTSRPC